MCSQTVSSTHLLSFAEPIYQHVPATKGKEVKDSSAETGGQRGTQVTGTVALTSQPQVGPDQHLSVVPKGVGISSLPTLS